MSLLAALKLPALDSLESRRHPAAAVAARRAAVVGRESDAPVRASESAAAVKPSPAAAGQRAGVSSVQFAIPVKVPDKDFGYVTCGGSVTFGVSAKPEGEDPDVEVKIKNLKPEVEA